MTQTRVGSAARRLASTTRGRSARDAASGQGRIRDRDCNGSNFVTFRRCSVVDNGQTLVFRYPSGDQYRVPLGYLLRWFHEPHYRRTTRGLVDWSGKKWDRKAVAAAKRCRRIIQGFVCLVEFDTGDAVEVAWDTVLMCCEPRYEHFGGLTDESRALFPRLFRKWRPVHVPPRGHQRSGANVRRRGATASSSRPSSL